jgi:DNA-binding transcriptional LysR family regulator
MHGSAGQRIDWNLIQSFLAVVEHGAVARAASATNTSQPTISRHIATLEEQIGAALFIRGARGTQLTAAGEALVEPARQMREAAQTFGLTASGQSSSMTGTVRISASEMTSVFLLPPILAKLRQSYPQIHIELVASNEVNNLLEREADIAIRMTAPGQSALVARRIGELALGGYASQAYLAQKPVAFTPETALQFDWIGHDRNDMILRAARPGPMPLTRESFAFRSDHQVACWQALLHGLGIGFCFDVLAARHPELVRVLPKSWIPPVPVWLTAPTELRSNPRMRVVYDFLAIELAAIATS